MTVTVTPIAEPGNVPPRVRLDVSDTGGLTSVTVTRHGADGRTVPVRTIDGGPLALSSGTGLLYDYEVPYGQGVSYSTLEDPGTVSAQTVLDVDQMWLVHPGVPDLSMPVDFLAGSFEAEELAVQQGVFWPMGREHPVVNTDGQRKAAAGSFAVSIESQAELQSLRALLWDASVLYLNVPASFGIGVDSCYIAVGAVRNRRMSTVGTSQLRAVELPYQVVDRPAGGSQAERTYVDVLVGFASYAEVMAAYDTYFDLLAGP